MALCLAEGMGVVTSHWKDILTGLRELKKSSTMAFDMLKVFSEGSDSSAVSFLYFMLEMVIKFWIKPEFFPKFGLFFRWAPSVGLLGAKW